MKALKKSNTERRILIFSMVAIFLVWAGTSSVILMQNNDRKNTFTETVQESYSGKIDAAVMTYEEFSNYVFESQINTPYVTERFAVAAFGDDGVRGAVREELYVYLKPTYETLQDYGFRQLHFHFEDSTSFLRVHRPERFGDSLKDVRYTVNTANEEKAYVAAFEEGRVHNGYRFVYPMAYERRHIGTVEVSIASGVIMEAYVNQYSQANIYFIMSKDAVKETVFDSEQTNYLPSVVSPDYLYDRELAEVSNAINHLFTEDEELIFFETVKEACQPGLLQNESFNVMQQFGDGFYVVQFVAVKNLIEETVGYYIIINEEIQAALTLQDMYRQLAMVTVIALLLSALILLWYRILERYKKRSNFDHLTGLRSRRNFNDMMDYEFDMYKRYGTDVSVLMFDIDHFKQVNDTYGHNIGDVVLVNLGQTVKDNLRKNDLLGRWGGEEFIVLMPNTDRNCAGRVAEKIRKIVESQPMANDIKITISIGYTQVRRTDEKTDDIVLRVDQAMYMAKRQGRNQAVAL